MFEKGCSYYLLCLTTLIGASTNGFAGSPQGVPRAESATLSSTFLETLKSSGVATLSLGPVWERSGKTQTFYLAPNIEKTYAATPRTHALMDGELFLGIQKPLFTKLAGQIGLAIATTGNATMSGNIWDDAEPQFNNYTYTYQIKHSHVALKGKLLADGGYIVIPWVSGSVGVGFNQAHGFSNQPLISQAIAMPNFTNHTTTAFTYTLGAGIARRINSHWQAGIGYEYADWGKSQLSPASGQTLNSGLALSHLYTNGLLFNLTYLA